MSRKPKTVKEITKAYLEANGFDGLCSQFAQCACLADDLFPCGAEDSYQCEPGYLTKCTPRNCSNNGDCYFHITVRKPRKR